MSWLSSELAVWLGADLFSALIVGDGTGSGSGSGVSSLSGIEMITMGAMWTGDFLSEVSKIVLKLVLCSLCHERLRPPGPELLSGWTG